MSCLFKSRVLSREFPREMHHQSSGNVLEKPSEIQNLRIFLPKIVFGRGSFVKTAARQYIFSKAPLTSDQFVPCLYWSDPPWKFWQKMDTQNDGSLGKNMFPKINMFFEKGPFQKVFFIFQPSVFGVNARGVLKLSFRGVKRSINSWNMTAVLGIGVI